MDRRQDIHVLEERIYELVDGYLQEADCYATAPVLVVWKRCGKLNVAVDVETNLKLTKPADVFPISDVLRPTEEVSGLRLFSTNNMLVCQWRSFY